MASANLNIDEDRKLMEVGSTVARRNCGKLLYQSLAKYAGLHDCHIMSSRDGDTREGAHRQWNAFNKGWFDCNKITLPDELNDYILEERDPSDCKPLLNAYQMEPDLLFRNRLVDMSQPKNVKEVEQILNETEDFYGTSYDLDSNKWIDEDHPLPKPDYYKGLNILTEQDQERLEEVYYSGRCMYLAMAIHERFGFDIEAHTCRINKELCIEHAWASLDNETHIDIIGPYAKSKEWTGNGNTLRNLTPKDILTLMQTPSSAYPNTDKATIKQGMLDAHSVIDHYLMPNFSKTLTSNNNQKPDVTNVKAKEEVTELSM